MWCRNPYINDELDNPGSTILNLCLLVWAVAELWMTALMDPGVIPRVDNVTRRKLGFLARRHPPDTQVCARVPVPACLLGRTVPCVPH